MPKPVSKIEYGDSELIGSYSIEDGNMVMRLPIAPRLAKAGKSMLLCSTRGAETFTHDGMDIRMNINCYVPIDMWNAKAKKSKKS